MHDAIRETRLSGLAPPRRGKVRDIYDLGEQLLIVSCDRISAYDHVLHPPIPDKGKILNQLTNFWFETLSDIVPNHLLTASVDEFPPELHDHRRELAGRSALVRRADVIRFECVARGYLAGSAWREYEATGDVCGIALPPDLDRAARLPEPIFTPATKAESGHDENVSFETLRGALGEETARRLRATSLLLYERGHEIAAAAGLILADTKFEFGWVEGRLTLIDEVLTPDSSRYWEAEGWVPGEEPPSFDKQFVRNWLDGAGWDHESPPPELPGEIVEGTRERYLEAFRRLTGRDPDL